MANHGLSSEQARQIGAKTLWIGDIEPWMDEQYIMGLFNKVSTNHLHIIIITNLALCYLYSMRLSNKSNL